MSAYMVNRDTINKVLSILTHNEFYTIEAKKKLAQELIEMNADAVSTKYTRSVHYPDYELDEIYIDHYKYERGDRELLCPLIKAMDCFLYQCMEGEVPQYRLYQRCEEARNDMMAMVIGNLPEYENASWG